MNACADVFPTLIKFGGPPKERDLALIFPRTTLPPPLDLPLPIFNELVFNYFGPKDSIRQSKKNTQVSVC